MAVRLKGRGRCAEFTHSTTPARFIECSAKWWLRRIQHCIRLIRCMAMACWRAAAAAQMVVSQNWKWGEVVHKKRRWGGLYVGWALVRKGSHYPKVLNKLSIICKITMDQQLYTLIGWYEMSSSWSRGLGFHVDGLGCEYGIPKLNLKRLLNW